MALDHARARQLVLASIATALLAGCGLTDLDLDGGAHVTAVKVASDAGFLLAVDGTQPLELTVVYDDGFEELAPRAKVVWTVDDPLIASIDGNAQLRGRGVGATGMTGRYAEHTAMTQVMVTDQVQGLEIQAVDRNCAIGERLAYGALLRYQHGSTELVTARVTWTSEQPAIASVEAGTVTGRAVGDTRIAAVLGALSATADVHVAAALGGSTVAIGAAP